MVVAWISVASLALGSRLKRRSYSGFVDNAVGTSVFRLQASSYR
jgi:hypothetical protein